MKYIDYYSNPDAQVRLGFALRETQTSIVILMGDGPDNWTVVPRSSWERIMDVPVPEGEDRWVASEIEAEVWGLLQAADISGTRAGKAAIQDAAQQFGIDLE